MSDTVNHPQHYTYADVECIDAIEAALESEDRILAYYEGNILKYVWRWRTKGGIEDLRKAKWYLDRMIAKLDENRSFTTSGKTYERWLAFDNACHTAKVAELLGVNPLAEQYTYGSTGEGVGA